MKLKAIEMQGFKSFPEKTKMTFGDGMTAIIGPNGSGKSNISDAIRWVLGEMSAKSLRGKKMEDVIFNGTTKRLAANYAAVSIYLDTTEEYMAKNGIIASEEQASDVAPKMRLSDEAEFVITRKYYRYGESEYYINKKQVKLKDIYELFYDTGIGREGYSVIGQGKISEVLSAKGDERRSIFEEASGISKFRYKKTEAERKLRDTDANLERINDIFSEVDSRIEPLRKESENAVKYLELSEEKKKLEITIMLEKIDTLRKNLSDIKTVMAVSQHELDMANDDLASAEREDEEFTNQGYSLMQRKSELDAETSEIQTELSELQRINSLYENDAKHFADKIESNKKEADFVSSKITVFNEQLGEQRRVYEDIRQSADVLKLKGRQLEQQRDAIMAPGEEKRKKRDEETAKVAEITEKLGITVQEEASTRALLEASEANGKNRDSEIEKVSARLNELKSIRDELETLRSEKSAEVERIRSGLELAEKEIAECEKLRDEQTVLASSIGRKAAAAEQQRESLLRLERLFEGYSDSVKTVMRQASDGRIKNGGRPIHLRGTVASLLSTEGEYVVAIETALGASVQFIVSETESDAKAALNYLKATGGGRITVLPLDTVKGKRCDVSRIESCDGYVGIASDLVICDREYKGIADDLLGRTVIAEDLEKASVIARKCGYSVKIVTKDGQIINAGGSYTGGSSQKKVGLFTRSADIDKLDEEISALNTSLTDAEMKKRNAERRIAAIKEENSEKTLLLDSITSEYNDIRDRFASSDAVFNEEKSKLQSILDTKQRSFEETKALKERLIQSEENEKALREAKSNSEKNIASYNDELEKISSGTDDIREQLSKLGMELVSFNARSESVSERIEELELRITEETEKLKEIEQEILSYNESIKSGESMVASNNERISDLESRKSIALTEKQSIDVLLEEREKTAQDRKQRLKTAQTRREQAFLSHIKLQTGEENAQKEYDSTMDYLWQEYELTYTAAEAFRLPEDDREKMPSRLNSVKAKIRAMGTINVKAVEEYKELKERHDFLKTQIDDLNRTRRKLDSEINRLATQMKNVFMETFSRIDTAFNRVFVELFGGGNAKLELADPENPLECGIDIILHPPGKSVRSISLLSGGEQSFAAVALYLALQEINPAPFCILDEIESALDEVNQAKLMDYIKAHCENTQYLLITHRRSTMERSDVLYGITMREKGVSEYLKLDLKMIGERLQEYTGDRE